MERAATPYAYDPRRMRRPLRALLVATGAVAVILGAAACGTQRISVPRSDPDYAVDVQAAQLFQQRCAGCHTLAVAGTHGSGANPRTYEEINGPNFNVRCERPAIRVLYAIENGGFSGAYMPQNIVVGQQAREVAMFVSKFAGSHAVYEPASALPPCKDQAIGTLPALPSVAAAASAGSRSATR
jgi:mono/diheme cytochrome c family protein